MPGDFLSEQAERFQAVHCDNVADLLALCEDMRAWLQQYVEKYPTQQMEWTLRGCQIIAEKSYAEASKFCPSDVLDRMGQPGLTLPMLPLGVLRNLTMLITSCQEENPPASKRGKSNSRTIVNRKSGANGYKRRASAEDNS